MDNNNKKIKKTPPKQRSSHERMSREAFKSVVKFGNVAYPFALAEEDESVDRSKDDSPRLKKSPIIFGGKVKGQQQQQQQKQQEQQKSPDSSPEEDWDKLDGIILIDSSEELHKLKVFKYKEIKNYIKGEVLGRGKFGVVREFIDKRTLKRYAGKIIRKGIINRNYHLRQQINKELAITYHFKHRNVLRVYDLYATRQKIYMFMEFCYGELAEFIKTYGKLPPFQSKDYFSQIIEGLNYLHLHGIIHRDVKPENILITPDHTIKLADYGVCQEVSYFTIDDSVFGCDGTPLYHPPEMFNQKILTYSGSKIDIWAAGVVLFKMLTGRLPFFYRDNTTQEDIDEILTGHVQYPQLIRTNVLLLDLLNRIFEKDFKDRISITEIKKHPWMQVDHNQKRNEKYFVIPTEVHSASILDSYRGLTVHTRIYNKYYPPQHSEQFVSFQQFQESCKMLPLTRGARYVHEPKRINLIKKRRNRIKFL